jgi:hypothetical protein
VRPLVAYYSLSGFTEKLAVATAGALAEHDVELLKIVPARRYSYFSAGIRGVTEAMAGTMVDLVSPIPEAGSFDALAVFSPTWGWMSSPPVRSFVARLPDGGGLPAVVGVTHSGGPIGSFERLAGLVVERGYTVFEALSVFCYRRIAIEESAGRAAAALVAANAGRAALEEPFAHPDG